MFLKTPWFHVVNTGSVQSLISQKHLPEYHQSMSMNATLQSKRKETYFIILFCQEVLDKFEISS